MNDAHDNAQTDADMFAKFVDPATEPQLLYFHSLACSRNMQDMVKKMPDQWLVVMHDLLRALQEHGARKVYTSQVFAKKDLSKFIGELAKQPKLPDRGVQPPNPETEAYDMVCGPAGDPATDNVQALVSFTDGYGSAVPPGHGTTKINVELEDGMYRGPGPNHHIYKVYHTVHGSNQQVAKRLLIKNPDTINGAAYGESVKVSFKYEGKAPLKFLKPDMRLTIEEARDFGALYGTCVVCGRTLTNELSIHLGIGPICGQREFGGDFEFMIKATELKLAGKL